MGYNKKVGQMLPNFPSKAVAVLKANHRGGRPSIEHLQAALLLRHLDQQPQNGWQLVDEIRGHPHSAGAAWHRQKVLLNAQLRQQFYHRRRQVIRHKVHRRLWLGKHLAKAGVVRIEQIGLLILSTISSIAVMIAQSANERKRLGFRKMYCSNRRIPLALVFFTCSPLSVPFHLTKLCKELNG